MLNDNVLNFFNKKNCLITGVPLIGRQIANILVEAGAFVKVISLDNIK